MDEFQIGGLPTDLDFLKQIIESPQFAAGKMTTTYLETFQPEAHDNSSELEREIALVAALYAHHQQVPERENTMVRPDKNPWQDTAWQEQMSGRS